jgi:predicted amidophosphoribosyltransferase
MARALRAGAAALADLALPGECAGCGAAGRAGLCPACAEVLRSRPFPVRPVRGRAALPVVYALARYQEPLSELIIAQKERGRLDLAGPLGRALADVVRAAVAGDGADAQAPGDWAERGIRSAPDTAAADPPPDWAVRRIFVVPVPSARAAERRRGQDPVLRMARAAAARLRREGARAEVLRALRHGRAVADQVGLGVAARAANLAGAMRVTGAGQRALARGPSVVVLVDDVCTSGATLGEAARAVGAAPGFRGCGGRVLAAVLAGPVR